MKKKILSLALALLMILSLMPTMALAEGNVSVSSFEELKTALSSAETSLTISVSGSIDVTETLVISGNKTVTIDGGNTAVFNRVGGKDVTFFSVEKGSSLTLKNFTVEGNCKDWTSQTSAYKGYPDFCCDVIIPEGGVTGTKFVLVNKGDITIDHITFQNIVNTAAVGVLNTEGTAIEDRATAKFINGCVIDHCANYNKSDVRKSQSLVMHSKYSNVDFGTLEICGLTVKNCYASGNAGSYVAMSDTGRCLVTINNVHFTDNIYCGNGMFGSIWNMSEFVINGGVFENTTSYYVKGGSNQQMFMAYDNSIFTINGGTFRNNNVGVLFGASGQMNGYSYIYINGGDFEGAINATNPDLRDGIFALNQVSYFEFGPDVDLTKDNYIYYTGGYWSASAYGELVIKCPFAGKFDFYNVGGKISFEGDGKYLGDYQTHEAKGLLNGCGVSIWDKTADKSAFDDVTFVDDWNYCAYNVTQNRYSGWLGYRSDYPFAAFQLDMMNDGDLIIMGANGDYSDGPLLAMHLWIDMNGFTVNDETAFPESLVDYDNGWRVIDHGDGLYEITDRFTRIYKSTTTAVQKMNPIS